MQLAPSQNQIAYVFDQEVRDPVNTIIFNSPIDPVCEAIGDPPGCQVFKYIDQAGDDHYSIGAFRRLIPW